MVNVSYFFYNFDMKTSFSLSNHALEKPLDATNLSASVFFTKGVMYSAIRQCLEKLDIKKRYGKRVIEQNLYIPYRGVITYGSTQLQDKSDIYYDKKVNFCDNGLSDGLMDVLTKRVRTSSIFRS